MWLFFSADVLTRPLQRIPCMLLSASMKKAPTTVEAGIYNNESCTRCVFCSESVKASVLEGLRSKAS